MSITVYSSLTGGKDALVEEQVTGDAKFVMFSDTPIQSKVWEHRKAYDRFIDPRRNSRAPKILAHQFIDTEYSIYMDANMSLLSSPESLIDEYLQDYDIALFSHTARDCLYDEAARCAKSGLDDSKVFFEQVAAYETAGFGKQKGMCECGFILRRQTSKVAEFNNAWWSEYCRHSVRDQISFPFAVDTVGIRVNVIKLPWHLALDHSSAVRKNVVKMFPHVIANPRIQ